MSSQRQIEANRKNSQKSTGPKTIQGKCVVSQNSIKHGILSSRVIIDDEEQCKFTEFAMRLNTELGKGKENQGLSKSSKQLSPL